MYIEIAFFPLNVRFNIPPEVKKRQMNNIIYTLRSS